MTVFHAQVPWFEKVLPGGIAVPTSILISGPGGSGKPLIGLGIVAAWLRSGGSVVFIPLQHPGREVVEKDMKDAYGLDLDTYRSATAFIRFDRTMDPYKKRIMLLKDGELSCNLTNPDNFSRAIDLSAVSLPGGGPGTLIFASAINLLLFSKTFADGMLATLDHQLRGDRRFSWLYTASTSTLHDRIVALEDAADTVLISESRTPGPQILVRVTSSPGEGWSREPVVVDLEPVTLERIKRRAEESRIVNIPALREI